MIVETPVPLRVLIVYIAVTHGQNLANYAPRFTETFLKNGPGFPCDIVIACNGGVLPPHMRKIVDDFAKQYVWGTFEYLHRPNDGGYDLSAYQEVAHTVGKNYDFLLCFGESVYFFRPLWARQLAEARLQLGPGMYGVFATNLVRTHLQTTAFGIDPKFLRAYPPITNHDERYEAEHGPSALWRRLGGMGGRAWMVTWDGCWEPQEWRLPQNIIWRGDQSNCLMHCNHTERFRDGNALVRFTWQANADQPARL